ncbi:MAG: LysR family transcriptional regulator [Rhodospirillum sp.]|nr:LysR family transcriptional regulator [Rhodospirillum sp.]
MAMRFDLVDLRLFVCVASCGSLTKAAETFPIALAAVSARMKALEESLCVPLLERKSRGVCLTPAGEVFLERSLAILKEASRLREDLQQFGDGTRGTIRLLANTNAINEFLPDLLADFLSRNPNITIEMKESTSSDCVSSVDAGEADLGIMAGQVSTRRLTTYHFRTDFLVVVTPENHTLSSKTSVKFHQVLDWDFVGMGEQASAQLWLNKVALLLGQNIRFRIQLHGFDAICRMVQAGVGVSIIPLTVAMRLKQSTRFAIVTLDEEWARRDLKLIHRNTDTLAPHVHKLTEYLANVGRQNLNEEAFFMKKSQKQERKHGLAVAH